MSRLFPPPFLFPLCLTAHFINTRSPTRASRQILSCLFQYARRTRATLAGSLKHSSIKLILEPASLRTLWCIIPARASTVCEAKKNLIARAVRVACERLVNGWVGESCDVLRLQSRVFSAFVRVMRRGKRPRGILIRGEVGRRTKTS